MEQLLKRKKPVPVPLCPLRQIACAASEGDASPFCVQEMCAWWDADEEGTCALVSLSRSLRCLTAVPDILRGNVPL